jgi:hypothetical protein
MSGHGFQLLSVAVSLVVAVRALEQSTLILPDPGGAAIIVPPGGVSARRRRARGDARQAVDGDPATARRCGRDGAIQRRGAMLPRAAGAAKVAMTACGGTAKIGLDFKRRSR